MISNFSLVDNLFVEFLLPDVDSPSFILGISELGGTDVLGGFGEFIINLSLLGGSDVLAPSSGFKWQDVGCETADAQISIGGSVEDAIYFEPEPATAKLTLQSYDLDPTVNQNIRANTKIRVRLQSNELDRVLFVGYIDTIDVTYYPDGLNLIRITAYDIYKSLVNLRIEDWDTTGLPAGYATTDEVFELIGLKTGIGLSAQSQPTIGKIPAVQVDNILVPEIINDAIDVGLAVVWIDQDTEELRVIPRPTSEAGTPETFIIGNNHPAPGVADPYHLCLAEINVNSDSDAVYNSLRVSLASDEETSVFLFDQDSIDLYGESAIDVSINTTDATELDRWATAVYVQDPTKLVSQVVTPTKDRLGDLTDAAVFTPGTLIGVSYTTNQLDIVGYYTVIRVDHEIDVDNWFTTLELWKAA
jgi:hypothetical protein